MRESRNTVLWTLAAATLAGGGYLLVAIAIAQAAFDECDDSFGCLANADTVAWLLPGWLATSAAIWAGATALRGPWHTARPARLIALPPLAAAATAVLVAASGLQVIGAVGYLAAALVFVLAIWLAR